MLAISATRLGAAGFPRRSAKPCSATRPRTIVNGTQRREDAPPGLATRAINAAVSSLLATSFVLGSVVHPGAVAAAEETAFEASQRLILEKRAKLLAEMRERAETAAAAAGSATAPGISASTPAPITSPAAVDPAAADAARAAAVVRAQAAAAADRARAESARAAQAAREMEASRKAAAKIAAKKAPPPPVAKTVSEANNRTGMPLFLGQLLALGAFAGLGAGATLGGGATLSALYSAVDKKLLQITPEKSWSGGDDKADD